ncbi:MAG TPA: DNA helicase PcrA [Lachnospiraceae bacterium]|nr:DNA helicase PcrA [Lachnospiraceae bacterium]
MGYLEKLNPQQREAVQHTEGPLLILAGAGSGKTRVLTCRIAYLIEHCGVRPWNIMAITFTNKAAGEMRERVDGLVGMGSEAIWVSTFHSSCCRILRRYIDRIGYDNSFTIYDTDDSRQVMKAVIKELELNPKIYKEKALLGKISAAKNNLVSPDEMEADASRWEEKQTARAYRAYQKRLKKNNALDFDDLLVLAVELFEKAPDVLESYQERFRYILIDEYQDTNTVQFRFVKLLAEKYRNICVVGDDDQSIYKFRGANIMNILNFEKSFPGAKVIKLEQNYRSTQSILDAANEVISNNSGRKEKKLWTDNGQGTRVRFREFQTGYDEAEFVAGEIAKKVREENRSYRDYAVLYRTNAQSRLFEEKMIAADIPYKLVGGVNFYSRREIKDMLAYLKTVDNGLDDLAVQRIVNVPKRGVGATSLARVQNYALENGISFYEALQDADRIPGLGRSLNGIRKFTTLIGRLRAAGREYLNVREILEMIISETGYVAELEEEGTDEDKARIENINELVSKTADYMEQAENPSLSEFLQQVSLVADIDSVDPDGDYVLLMTLHSAKGLEFDYVYMTGMEENTFPSYMAVSGEDSEELEEERRLCYVGITRARKELTMTAAQMRMVRGEPQFLRASRFVREIPRDLIELEGETTDTRNFMKPPEVSMDRIMKFGTVGAERGYGSFGSRPVRSPRGQAGNHYSLNQFRVQKADHLDYQEGDRVRHVKFGDGTVQNIKDGGKDYEVTVDFDTCGVKRMFASFAKLKKI